MLSQKINVFVFCKDIFPYIFSFLRSLGDGLHFNSVKGQNLGWINLFTEKNKNSQSKCVFLVRIEMLWMSCSKRFIRTQCKGPCCCASPALPVHYHTHQPLCEPSPVSDPSLWDSVGSSHGHSLEASWGKFSTGVYERRLSPQLTPAPGEIFFFGCVQLMLGRRGWAGIKSN